MENDLLEPELLYKRELKDKHHQTVVDYFKQLVEKSGVNSEENIAHCDKIYAKQAEAKKIEKDLNTQKGLKIFLIVLIVFGGLAAAIGIFLLIIKNIMPGVITLVLGLGFVVLGIVLITAVLSKRIKKFQLLFNEISAEIEKLIAEAWTKMGPLNALFYEEMSPELLQKTTPLIKMDRTFDTKKLEFLVENYGYTYRDEDNCSKVAIQSGSILGNPFAFFKELEMNIVPHTYEGTLVITWTTTVSTKNGIQTRTHTQTLRATVTKPRPEYSLDTYLMYANEAAPNLSFSRRPSNIGSFDEKGLEKYVRKHEGDLTKLAEKQMGKGGNYTPLGNAEFELFFGGLDRDNEVEYRLLFTPLAQKSMLSLLKSKEGYGDDFTFVKKKMINFLTSSHSQGTTLFSDASYYHDFDIRKIEQKFVNYNDFYFKAVFFDLAPLLSIPLYQQHKAREYIYKGTIPSKFSDLDHEAIANKFDVKNFCHPDTATKTIIKTDFVKPYSDGDVVKVTAHSFQEIKHVDVIPKLGGDGRMHGVPVTWYEYIPLEQDTLINVAEVGGNEADFARLGNNNVIFNRGLVSYNQETPLNIPIKELKERMSKK